MENAQVDSTEEALAKQPKPPKIVVGFWYRFLSDVIDVVILGVLGALIAYPLKGIFFKLGLGGWWIGLIITFLYAGFLQTSIGEGQSLAKRFLGIQVLKLNGQFMSLQESFLRYSVLAFISYNSWIGIGLLATFPFLNNFFFIYLYFILVLFCFLGIVLLVPFHPLKQGIHDLLAKTVVVKKGTFSAEKLEVLKNPKKAERAYLIAGIGLFLIVSGPLINLVGSNNEGAALARVISERSQFQTVKISWQNKGPRKDYIYLSGFLKKEDFDDWKLRESLAREASLVLEEQYPGINKFKFITVKVFTGFSIGIARYYENFPITFPIGEGEG